MTIDAKAKTIVVSVNPKIYPLEVIYSAAYVFLDRAYLAIDGDPEKEVLVQIKPKNAGEDPEKLGNEFNNELVNYSVYVVQAVRNQPLRKAIIERALFTNTAETEYCDECGCELMECPDCGDMYCPTCDSEEDEEAPAKEEDETSEDEFIIDDPLGIAKPWKPPEGKENEKSDDRQKKGQGRA